MTRSYNVIREFSGNGIDYTPGDVVPQDVVAGWPNADVLLRTGFLSRNPDPDDEPAGTEASKGRRRSRGAA